MAADADRVIDAWVGALLARHTQSLTKPELLKAIRALSVRYVERRADLPRRSAIDSAGKRAAFAAFYAPLHFLTTLNIARALLADEHLVGTILDLGCGSGVASAAWALTLARPCAITGVDTDPWVLEEARWNWRQLGLAGRTRRDDLVRAVAAVPSRDRPASPASSASLRMFGWAINEIDARSRTTLLDRLITPTPDAGGLLVIEPIALTVSPWWPEWADRIVSAGGRADTWRIDTPLPPALADLDEAAGFDRDALTARSLWLPPRARRSNITSS
jgi:SAM-dependent methyltransferase